MHRLSMVSKCLRSVGFVTVLFLTAFTQHAEAQTAHTADAQQIARGRYLATAADCAACHGVNSAGGLAIATPMGKVYASNISPDPHNGIGKWTLQAFSDALRKGRSPDKGWLYPAMPYTAYTGLSDDDVKALYAYFHESVAPQSNKVPETALAFPFARVDMVAWNVLNLHEGHVSGAVPVDSETLARGQYLVETLGHCSTCHTPRNALMGEINSQHLAGGAVGTWVAPNITPSASGIGGWSDADLMQFLQTGNANGHVAAGDMGLAVEHSFSHLSQSDIAAMVAYLHKVPAVEGTTPHATSGEPKPLDIAKLESVPEGNTTETGYANVVDGGVLYQASCAACHGAMGEGTPDGKHPSLLKNGTVHLIDPSNLVQVIAHGIDVKTPQGEALMPGFNDQLSPTQIAALATYVRSDFGNVSHPDVTKEQVGQILSNQMPAPWLIRHAATLAIIGIVVVVLIALSIVGFAVTRRRRRVHKPKM